MFSDPQYWDERYIECRDAGVPQSVFEWFVHDVKDVVDWVSSVRPRLARSARVLELCCGTSALACALGARFKTIVATDFSANVIDEMRQKPHPRSVTYMQANALELPASLVTTGFDAIVAKAALDGLLGGGALILKQCYEALRPGCSLFLVSCYKKKILELFDGLPEDHLWKHEESRKMTGKGDKPVYFHRFVKTMVQTAQESESDESCVPRSRSRSRFLARKRQCAPVHRKPQGRDV